MYNIAENDKCYKGLTTFSMKLIRRRMTTKSNLADNAKMLTRDDNLQHDIDKQEDDHTIIYLTMLAC